MPDLSDLLGQLGGRTSAVFPSSPVGATGRTRGGYDPNLPIGVFQGSEMGGEPETAEAGGGVDELFGQYQDTGLGDVLGQLLGGTEPTLNKLLNPNAPLSPTPLAPTTGPGGAQASNVPYYLRGLF